MQQIFKYFFCFFSAESQLEGGFENTQIGSHEKLHSSGRPSAFVIRAFHPLLPKPSRQLQRLGGVLQERARRSHDGILIRRFTNPTHRAKAAFEARLRDKR